MSNTYYVIKKSLNEALDHIEKFQEKMYSFTEKYPNYIHSINMKKLEEEWEIEIKIETKNESTYKRVS